jgi:hypothetical protein
LAIFDDLEAAARDAGDRLGREAQPSLFDRIDWFRLVQEHTPEGEPRVIRVHNGVASCWLFLSARGRYAESLTNWYGLRYGPVVSGPRDRAPLGELARGLRKAGISHIFLEPTEEDERIAAELRRKGWLTARGRVNVNWRIETRGMSFEEYWATRSAKLRNTTARRAKKAKLDIVIHDRFDAAAWEDYVSVYEASWKPAEGAPEMLRRIAEQEGEAGTLRLGLAYREGKAVAAQLWLVETGMATIHKLAYREDARDFSPGTVLSRDMFQRALDVDKVDVIDFGVGNDAYKAEWMSECRPLYGITAYDMLSLSGLWGIAKAAGARLVGRLTGQSGERALPPRRRPERAAVETPAEAPEETREPALAAA